VKVIFLDIDGVLNTQMTPTRTSKKGYLLATDPYKVFLINRMAEINGYRFVLSSDWRHMKNWEDVLKANGLVFNFLGRTESFHKLDLPDHEVNLARVNRLERGYEIRDWLEKHDPVEGYVIIDDFDEFLPEQANNKVIVNHMVGLTEEIVEKVIHILEK
jgi:hypothetical protein